MYLYEHVSIWQEWSVHAIGLIGATNPSMFSRPPPPWVTIETPVAPASTLLDTGRALQKVHADGDLVGTLDTMDPRKKILLLNNLIGIQI